MHSEVVTGTYAKLDGVGEVLAGRHVRLHHGAHNHALALEAAEHLTLGGVHRRELTLCTNSCPARAMDSVADPAPALASTTSVPPFWMRTVRASRSASVKETAGVAWHVRPVEMGEK